ncbi:MAG: hypothetical protein KDK33_09130 [Leptospiraceae bacterium]|nr:hypothetical protein [Leptospiraceae bacterium]
MDILKEFWEFLKVRKKFWLLPILFMLVLIIGLAIFGGAAGGLSPFIYALF